MTDRTRSHDDSLSSSGRPVAESAITMSSLMLPSDANPMGNVHGGEVLKLIDTAAGVAARRHVRGPVVTARLDDMSFLHPVYIGNLLTVKASVNCTWHTSLEVGVRVEAEDLQSGERWHVASAYLILVGLGTDGRPTSVPPVLPVTSDEVRRYHGAVQRRTQRDARLQRRG